MTSATTKTPTLPLPAARSGGLWLPTLTLWRREMVRFLRQRNRVIGAVATPLVFWLLLGSGLNRSFSAPDALQPVGYLEYFFPGTVVMVLLFTAIFSTISVIEDRREGFMQGVLVAPIPRLAIVLGKVLGGATLATGQGLLFLLVWPIVGTFPGFAWMLAAVGVMFVLAVALTALGMCIAWPMDSTAGFHAVMNLFLMPMWFLSGAVFPINTAPLWLRVVMWCNPLTYGQAAFSQMLNAGRVSRGAPIPVACSLAATGAFAVAITLLAAAVVGLSKKDGSL
ncbi:MAG: ABC transporter permease [Planctomycetes bacterium]|nr:ABC transporter permease [Planctomycetota bacterium]